MLHVAPYADGEELARLIRDKSKISGKDYVVIDVRDDDYEGGHITGSKHFASGSLSSTMPEIINLYSQVPVVYFHCTLSQVRGPKSARMYKEALDLNGVRTDQTVKVLRGGFSQWQAKYRKEPGLIEDYNPRYWDAEFGMDAQAVEDAKVEDNEFMKHIPKSA
ncbi:hypothetical protein BZG36_05240 [Bifiguratus adelaidae]|uniref:Rhodanese domain-containing protein n=1 Tax=Bifiguratus adelaidae TaxID=1938954 RepID=A0A261XUV9_9FUNG|nr:hypothetical protein BZG36_05240 [Bifiguratus adelaidae]